MPTAARSRSRAQPAAKRRKRTGRRDLATRLRTPLLALAAVRLVVGLLALPLAPWLYREHYLVLVLMRPTKEVLLFGGFLSRQGKVHLLQILIAAVPLALLGVWHAFALGRGYRKEIKACSMPGLGGKLIPVERVNRLQRALKKKGRKLVLLGRLAVFPSSALGMAAGSSEMKPRKFVGVDILGGLLSIGEAVGAGYLLGAAYKGGKHWLTFVGLAALIGMGVILGRAMRRD